MKGVLEALLRGIRVPSYAIAPAGEIPWLNASDAALLQVDEGKQVGVLGSLAVDLEQKYKLRQPLYLAEIELEALAPHTFEAIAFEPLPRYPSAERDISIVVDRDLAYGKIQSSLANLKISELVKMTLVDVYEGEKIPDGKVSLTLRLAFQDRVQTLTVERVQNFVDVVLKCLNEKYGAERRSL